MLFKPVIAEISEALDGNTFDIVTRLCYHNAPNYNGISLVSNGELDENMLTIVNKPVVAYYKSSITNGENFGGHEAWIDWEGDMHFETSAVGVTKSAYIKMEMVKPVYSDTEVLLPVLYVVSEIWASRFPNYARVLKSLFKEDALGVSWELDPISVRKTDFGNSEIPNPRECDKYEYLGYALLGNDVTPAYGNTSKVVEVSTIQNLLSEALIKDIENANTEKNRRTIMEERISQLESELAEARKRLDDYEQANKDAEIASLKETVENLTNEKSELETKLVEASEKLEATVSEMAELKPFKEKVEAIEAEKALAEKEAKIAELKALATAGGYITEQEIETSEEIKTLIENLDEKGIKVIKAERILAQVEKPNTEVSTKEQLNEKPVTKNTGLSFLF